jgi:hypothetical protein
MDLEDLKMRKLNMDLCFQIVLFFLFSFLIWESRSYPFESKFYPRIISGVALILLLVSMVRHFRKKVDGSVYYPQDTLRRRRFLEMVATIVVATLLGFLAGFLVSILCYYVGYAFLQRDRISLIRTLAIGVTLTFLFYLSFGHFMKVPLLRGWLINF